jgi:23S rRNA pseudouridine1911/1915/1917 synthase
VTELVVPEAARGLRLDRYLATAIEGVSRAELQRWIEGGNVLVDGRVGRAAEKLRAGSRLEVTAAPAQRTVVLPDASVPFDVLHADDALVVVMKPAGVVVHPAPGHVEGTLVGGLLALGLFRAEDLVGEEGTDAHLRPGIVHRLDAGTSGVMVVARTPAAREALKQQFAEHTIERVYEAITVGVPKDGTVATLHGRHPKNRLRFTSKVREGKSAVTHVRVLERFEGAARVECQLETGRTHQIRVHLAEVLGTSVLGDPVYGRTPKAPMLRALAERLGHQALHARVLGFVHPTSNLPVRFEAPLPADMAEVLLRLRSGSED